MALPPEVSPKVTSATIVFSSSTCKGKTNWNVKVNYAYDMLVSDTYCTTFHTETSTRGSIRFYFIWTTIMTTHMYIDL